MGTEIIAYYRVSTRLQGIDGFGMAAQRTAVERYAAAYGLTILAAYSEVESARREHLRNRPQLVHAVAHARRAKAVLVIARFDRLARSVLVTSQLLESGVEFVACDSPHANRLTIHILAAMAEHEGRLISERTKAGIAAAKARGVRFGSCNLDARARALGVAAAVKARKARTREAYADLLPTLADMRRRGLSTIAIAQHLNEEGQRNQHGRPWTATTVNDLFRREGIAPLPTTFERRDEAFRALHKVAILAAAGASRERVEASDAVALPIAREMHERGAARCHIARELERRGVPAPRGCHWRGVSVLAVLRRHGIVQAGTRRVHRPEGHELKALVRISARTRHANAVAARAPYLAMVERLFCAAYTWPRIAEALNEYGYRPRRAGRWSASAIASSWRRSVSTNNQVADPD